MPCPYCEVKSQYLEKQSSMLRMTTLRSWEGRSPLVEPEADEEPGPKMRVRLMAQAVMSSRKNMDSRCCKLLWGVKQACSRHHSSSDRAVSKHCTRPPTF